MSVERSVPAFAWNAIFGKIPLSTPDRDSNLDHPVICILFFCENKTLDHVVTDSAHHRVLLPVLVIRLSTNYANGLVIGKVEFRGSEPAFAWRESGKPFRKNHPSSPDRDSNLDFPVLGGLTQHDWRVSQLRHRGGIDFTHNDISFYPLVDKGNRIVYSGLLVTRVVRNWIVSMSSYTSSPTFPPRQSVWSVSTYSPGGRAPLASTSTEELSDLVRDTNQV
ncbi:unnamed protein product, partial [Timema podura]|nr:unnamed protein product [Timema podura]